MEEARETHHGLFVIVSIAAALGVVSSALCLASEFMKTKRKELKVDGLLCYLPESPAVGLGVAALICLKFAIALPHLVVLKDCFSAKNGATRRSNKKATRTRVRRSLLLLSWACFGIVLVLVAAATSMNRRQAYGKGWLDGECYLVKDGVYIGSAALVLISIGSAIASIVMRIKESQAEPAGLRVHAQA